MNDNVFEVVDKASFFQLFFLAIVALLTFKRLACEESVIYGWIAGGILLAAYFLHCFSFAMKLDALIVAFFRSLCISQIGVALTSIFATILQLIAEHLRAMRYRADERRRDQEWKERREREKAEREAEREALRNRPPPPPRPPPPTPAERFDTAAKQAREQYEAEVATLQSLPLDEDEREVLMNRAKRDLLRKLQEVKR